MGLAAGAAFVILAGFALVASGTWVQAMLASQESVADAEHDRMQQLQAARTADLEVTDRLYIGVPVVGGTLDLWVDNTGGHAFEASRVEVLLDGVRRTDLITVREVDGDPLTDVWAPAEQLHLLLAGVAWPEPTRAWVVADTGAGAVG